MKTFEIIMIIISSGIFTSLLCLFYRFGRNQERQDHSFKIIDDKIQKLDDKIQKLDSKLEYIEKDLNQINTRLTVLESRVSICQLMLCI